MKVGTRITVATSALVAVTVGVYALFDLRAQDQQRHDQIEEEARSIAVSLRATLESVGLDRALDRARMLSEESSKAGIPWRVSVVPADTDVPPSSGRQTPQKQRLRKIMDVPTFHLAVQEGDTFIYVVPLRIRAPLSAEDFAVVGSLEVARPTAHLDDAFMSELLRMVPIMVLIVGITILAMTGLTRSLLTRPVDKLLAGIDDVAQGDLSRVLLSERDDEIGALATRFNDMTFSLRESRAETEQQNDARLTLEQRLGQSEKLATIGQLAAEIAHEVGTPLNVIAGRSKNLARKAGDPDAVQKNAKIIAEQTARITRIIQRLLDFTRSKVGTFEPEPVNLNDLIKTTIEFLEGKLQSGKIERTVDCAADLPAVKGDPDRLQQVLLNLLLNAIQAMPDGGALKVETSVVTRQRPGLEKAPEQQYAVIAVIDSGVGIAAEDREKIFEPFYTSKYETGGSGLGLAVCHGIVKEHDGWMDVADAPGGGTVFSVYLPVAG